MPLLVNAPQRQQVFIATYNAVCPRLFRSSQEFVVAGIGCDNLNQILRCNFQTVSFKEAEQASNYLGMKPKTWATKHIFVLAQDFIAEYCLEPALLYEQIYNSSAHTTNDAGDHRACIQDNTQHYCPSPRDWLRCVLEGDVLSAVLARYA